MRYALSAAMLAAALPVLAIQLTELDPETLDQGPPRVKLPAKDPFDEMDGERIPVFLLLQRVAAQECPAERCFDGQPVLRAEGPLVILKEERVGESRGGFKGPGGKEGGRRWEPPQTIYKQTVGIADREGYVKERQTDGAVKGGLLGGLAGILLGLVNPLLGVAALVVGIMVGRSRGRAAGWDQPRVFEREQSR